MEGPAQEKPHTERVENEEGVESVPEKDLFGSIRDQVVILSPGSNDAFVDAVTTQVLQQVEEKETTPSSSDFQPGGKYYDLLQQAWDAADASQPDHYDASNENLHVGENWKKGEEGEDEEAA